MHMFRYLWPARVPVDDPPRTWKNEQGYNSLWLEPEIWRYKRIEKEKENPSSADYQSYLAWPRTTRVLIFLSPRQFQHAGSLIPLNSHFSEFLAGLSSQVTRYSSAKLAPYPKTIFKTCTYLWQVLPIPWFLPSIDLIRATTLVLGKGSIYKGGLHIHSFRFGGCMRELP